MRIAITTAAASLAAVAALAASAPKPSPLGPPPPPGTGLGKGECILSRDIGNHSIVDKNTILFDVFAKGVYRATMRPACFINTISTDRLAFQDVALLCKPKDLSIIARGGACFTESIVKMTPEEVAALPRGMRP